MAALDAAARTAGRLRALGFVPLTPGKPSPTPDVNSRAGHLAARAAPVDDAGEGTWYHALVMPRLRAAACDGMAVEAQTGFRDGAVYTVTWVPRWVALVTSFAPTDALLKDLLFRLQRSGAEQQALEAALRLGGDKGFIDYLESIL